jgi:hypothetical protein
MLHVHTHPHTRPRQISTLLYKPPVAAVPGLVFSLVRAKNGDDGEALIWMDATNTMSAAFQGAGLPTIFRGVGE